MHLLQRKHLSPQHLLYPRNLGKTHNVLLKLSRMRQRFYRNCQLFLPVLCLLGRCMQVPQVKVSILKKYFRSMVYLLACFALRICKFYPKANLWLMGGLVSIWLWKKNIFPPFNPQLWLGKARLALGLLYRWGWPWTLGPRGFITKCRDRPQV